MRQVKILFSQNIMGLILFLGGAVLSVVLDKLIFDKLFFGSLALPGLIIVTVFLALSATYYFSITQARINSLTESIEITADYEGETYFGFERYRGLLYERLKLLVRSAKEEILALDATSSEKSKNKVSEHPSRAEYLKQLERTLEENPGIRYVRIEQVQQNMIDRPIRESISLLTTEHCRRILNMKKNNEKRLAKLQILKLASARQFSLIIVDKKTLFIEFEDLDNEGHPYIGGGFFLQDRRGIVANRFSDFFERLRGDAMSINEAEMIIVPNDNA